MIIYHVVLSFDGLGSALLWCRFLTGFISLMGYIILDLPFLRWLFRGEERKTHFRENQSSLHTVMTST